MVKHVVSNLIIIDNVKHRIIFKIPFGDLTRRKNPKLGINFLAILASKQPNIRSI
jgi:hypothetical protein